MRQLQTATLSNQNITSYLLVGTYTADDTRAIMVSVVLDQVAGGGDYLAYVTRQLAGAGSAYMVGPITTFTVPAAQTAVAFTSVLVPVDNTDVVKVYVKGLAGDTTTPDITTRIYELTYLRPTTAGNKLDVTATGAAGIDWANVENPTTSVNLSDTTVKTVTDLLAKLLNYVRLTTRKDAAVKTDLATELGEINANTGTGAGAYDPATDSPEAIRDQGDAAWTTATGFEAAGAAAAAVGSLNDLTAQEVRDSLKLAPTAGAPAAGSTDADLDTLTAGVNVTTIGGQAATAAAPVAFPAAVGTSTYAGGAVASVAAGVTLADDAITAAKIAAGAITASEAPALANLDAAVSSRSTYAGGDTAGTATLLARIIGTLAAGTHSPQSGDAYGRLTGTVEPLVSGVAAAVWAHATGIAVALAVTAASIRTAVWDAVAASYNAALSMGAKINAVAGLSPQEVRDSLKLAPTAGAPAAGSTDADLDTLTAGVNVTTIGGQAATAAAPVAFPAAVGTSTYAGGAAEPGDAMTLTGAYDAAKSAASATELAAVQTHGDSAWATATAAGSVEYPYVVTDPNGDPVPDSLVWVTAHGSGLILASGYTDETGSVLFALDPGSYDFRVRKGGFNSVVDTETVA